MRSLSRRSALGLIAAAGAVAGCSGGTGGSGRTPAPESSPPATALAAKRRSSGPIVWASWPDYLDRDGARRPTLEAFTRASGIEVRYRETINDNETFVDSIQRQLAARRWTGYDVVVLTDWMSARLAAAGQLERLVPALMPNARRVLPALSRPEWDPSLQVSRPWQAGLTGIAYNAREVRRPVSSVRELMTRADLRGGVALLSEFNDTVGMLLLGRGSDPTDFLPGEAELAIEQVTASRRSGHVAAIAGNDYIDRLLAGDLAASLAWSGDVIQAQAQHPELKFVVPEEGMMIWADEMLVPVGSKRAAEVSRLIDHYYDPQVAARVAAWVNYICPVQGAQDAMARIDPSLAESPLIFPDDQLLDRSRVFATLQPGVDTGLRARFAEAIA
jgi:spermidine/putrescine transport system substrate-binding protein